MSDEAVRLSTLNLAYTILLNRNPTAPITTEKVVEEAEKLERFIDRKPKPKGKKAEFLVEEK
jgi:hypothetical protein